MKVTFSLELPQRKQLLDLIVKSVQSFIFTFQVDQCLQLLENFEDNEATAAMRYFFNRILRNLKQTLNFSGESQRLFHLLPEENALI